MLKRWTLNLITLALALLLVLAISSWTNTATPEEPFQIGALLAPPVHAVDPSICSYQECMALVEGQVMEVAFWSPGTNQCMVTQLGTGWYHFYTCYSGGSSDPCYTGSDPTAPGYCDRPSGCDPMFWEPPSCCLNTPPNC